MLSRLPPPPCDERIAPVGRRLSGQLFIVPLYGTSFLFVGGGIWQSPLIHVKKYSARESPGADIDKHAMLHKNPIPWD
jgi:hypothetical protein